MQYESKASKHKPKTSTVTTRGQRARLVLGAHHVFCNTSIVFRVSFNLKRSLYAASSGQRAKIVIFDTSAKNFFCPLRREQPVGGENLEYSGKEIQEYMGPSDKVIRDNGKGRDHVWSGKLGVERMEGDRRYKNEVRKMDAKVKQNNTVTHYKKGHRDKKNSNEHCRQSDEI